MPMMQPSAIGQPSFFYYNPDPSNDHRQHGHFSQHPSAGHEDVMVQKTHQYYHPGMMMMQNPHMYPRVHHRPVLASPQPMQQRIGVLASSEHASLSLNTQCSTPGMKVNPATPALSAASGSSSSPSTCSIMPTPATGSFLGSNIIEGVKEGCEGDVNNEILAGGDFTRTCSPPLTPVFIHPPSLTASQATDLLSINSCPSLSPSPSPGPQSVTSDTGTNFCNPRNLLVNSTQSAQLVLDNFPPLPTLCSGDDEEHKLILGGEYSITKPDLYMPKTFESTFHGLSNLDSLSDLDSDNEFLTDLTRFENPYFASNKRRKLELVPSEDDSLLSDDSFDDFGETEQFASAGLMSPPESDMSPTEPDIKAKVPKKSRSPPKRTTKKTPGRAVTAESESTATHTVDTNDASENKGSSVQGSAAGSTDDNTATPHTPASTTSGNPTARRGRKQSLTDDPSKQFVCTLCSRRFRRQEHLKRHYRSLHTHDKPFKCAECGKQFSRSDNLSQHARTHGSGAITLGVLEEGELPPHENGEGVDQTEALGNRLFDAAVAAAGQSSSSSSASSVGSQRDSTSPTPSTEAAKTMKKRKRED